MWQFYWQNPNADFIEHPRPRGGDKLRHYIHHINFCRTHQPHLFVGAGLVPTQIYCHCEPFPFCHSEPKAKNLTSAQGKLRVAIPGDCQCKNIVFSSLPFYT